MSSRADIKRILFVCTGNICRSPTAEGVFRKLLRDAGMEGAIAVDSAGTHAFRSNAAPDPNAVKAAEKRGIDIRHLKARLFDPGDFFAFDLIVAMDRDNRSHLRYLCPPGEESKLCLLMQFASRFKRDDVPDPYGGGYRGFENAIDMIEDGCRGLLEELHGDRRAAGDAASKRS